MQFIFDLDGTICFKGRPVSKAILDVLVELQQEGHTVAFASARPCRDMLPVLDERFAHHLMIGANGAMTHQGGRLQHFVPIPPSMAKEIMALLDDYGAKYVIDDTWNYAFNCEDDHPFLMNIDAHRAASRVDFDQIDAVLKMLVLSCEKLDELSARMKAFDVTMHFHSAEGILDLTYQGVNKMTALEKSGVQPGEMICFGNDMNDLPMFEKARYSVVIGAYEPLLRLADAQIAADEKAEQTIVTKLQELRLTYTRTSTAVSKEELR